MGVLFAGGARALLLRTQNYRNMIQTSYVPLEKPYHIIENNGDIGIKIGTLIVTREKYTAEPSFVLLCSWRPASF